MKRPLLVFLSIIFLMMTSSAFAGDCGDANNSGTDNILDITYLINYLYKSGPAPNCGTSFTGVCGDVNSSGNVNVLDVTYFINYLYKGGTVPYCREVGELSDIDGNIYPTVKIGDQWWMAENLKVTHYRNGDVVPNVTDGITWSGLTAGAYCEYDNDANNVATYGRLYNWHAVADSRNIAPAGWHLPTDTEWQTLVDYLGGDAIAGRKMKEPGTTHWNDPNTDATNESGFSALPGGYCSSSGIYGNLGLLALFWSSTEFSSSFAWSRYLNYNYWGVIRVNYDKKYGFSLRCIKDL